MCYHWLIVDDAGATEDQEFINTPSLNLLCGCTHELYGYVDALLAPLRDIAWKHTLHTGPPVPEATGPESEIFCPLCAVVEGVLVLPTHNHKHRGQRGDCYPTLMLSLIDRSYSDKR